MLALLAQGATNRQIGASLFMAEKTASVHVSRILAKLGVHSRTQAAAVAHRLHLTPARPADCATLSRWGGGWLREPAAPRARKLPGASDRERAEMRNGPRYA